MSNRFANVALKLVIGGMVLVAILVAVLLFRCGLTGLVAPILCVAGG